MPDNDRVEAQLHKRLLPLYISAFFQNFVLWYTIEKLFMQRIGFNNTGIGAMVALYSAVMLTVEVPSGILADRWSRKGVLIIASLCLALSSLVGGLSHGPGMYLLAAVLWGIFYACYSGMYDSIIYDCIAETAPGSKLFDRLYGRNQVYDSVGLVLGSLLGAFLAATVSLRAVYFLTIPLSLVAIVALLRFREPTLHKKQAVIPIGRQVSATFRAVTTNRALLPVIVVLILRSTLVYCIYEFSQLWLLALHTPTSHYGIANSAVLASIGFGGALVSRLHLIRHKRMLLTLAGLLLSGVGLIFFRNIEGVVASQFLFASSLVCIYIIFSRLLHDNLEPSIRAGAASAASTMARFLIIPVALVFGLASQKFTVYKASYMLLAGAVVLAAFVVVVSLRNGRTGLRHKTVEGVEA